MTRSSEKKRAREKLYFKQNGCCHYCGKKIHISHGNVDHVIPKSLGGTEAWDNLVFSCTKCNQAKANSTHYEYVRRKLLDIHAFLSSHAVQQYMGGGK